MMQRRELNIRIALQRDRVHDHGAINKLIICSNRFDLASSPDTKAP
jgi:hypothetical protein